MWSWEQVWQDNTFILPPRRRDALIIWIRTSTRSLLCYIRSREASYGWQRFRTSSSCSWWVNSVPQGLRNLTLSTSYERRVRDDCQRCLYEPIRRYQATNASAWLSVSINRRVRATCLQKRRTARFLRLLPHYAHDDRPVHGTTIHRIRISHQSHAKTKRTGLRSTHALHGWRIGRRYRSSGNNTPGRCQDVAANARRSVRS